MKIAKIVEEKCVPKTNANHDGMEYCPKCESLLFSCKREEYCLVCRKCGYEKIVSEDVYEAHKFELHIEPREIGSEKIPIIDGSGKREEHATRKPKYRWE